MNTSAIFLTNALSKAGGRRGRGRLQGGLVGFGGESGAFDTELNDVRRLKLCGWFGERVDHVLKYHRLRGTARRMCTHETHAEERDRKSVV